MVFIYVNLCGNCIVIVNESQTIISRKVFYCHFEMVELLGVRGFSETYIRLMRQFFETWEVLNKSSATADDLGTTQINTLDLNELGMASGTDRLRSSGL